MAYCTHPVKQLINRSFKHVEEINDTSGEMRIEGFISLEGAYSKVDRIVVVTSSILTLLLSMPTSSYVCMLIFIQVAGGRSCPRADINKHAVESGELHRCVDALFNRSSFSQHVRSGVGVHALANREAKAYDERGVTSTPRSSMSISRSRPNTAIRTGVDPS